MPVFLAHGPASDPSLGADLLLVPNPSPAQGLAPRLDRITRGGAQVVARAVDLGDFQGKPGDTLSLVVPGVVRFPRILLVGLGEDDGITPASVRTAFANAARARVIDRVDSVAVECGALGTGARLRDLVAAAVDGILEGTYRWSASTKPAPHRPGRWVFLARTARGVTGVEQGIRAGRSLGEAVLSARRLADEPANRMSPAALAEEARSLGKQHSFAVRVLGPAGIAKENMEALLAVGSAAATEPRFIVMEHEGDGGAPIVLVGKGLVFDSGGLSIKPSLSMAEMKYDKCGGCAVIGAMQAVASRGVRRRVIGLVPAVENMISGTAYRPGDVIGSRSGKTIEVLNTDAEGRIVLADALDYAVTRYDPAAVVDLATLTGAVFGALGDRAAAILGTDSALIQRLRDAGTAVGENLWQLPLEDGHRQDVETPNADVRNTGKHGAGTIAGAAFLREFTRDASWAHLDIASVGRARRGPHRGATGFGVRLLTKALASWPGGKRAARK